MAVPPKRSDAKATATAACFLIGSALSACTSPHPLLRRALVDVSASDTKGIAWHATTAHPFQLRVSHGSLTAYAIYPITDYDNDPVNATRFRVSDAHEVILDKLIDAKPLKISIVTATQDHLVSTLDTYSGGAHCCFGTAVTDPNMDGAPTFTNTTGAASATS